MAHSIQLFPEETIREWQDIVDLLARIAGVRSALVMHLVEEYVEVLVSSNTPNNPYHVGDQERLFDSGLYCEEVVKQQEKLYVPDALESERWKNNPDLKLGMVCYLGFPIRTPDGKPFGTICLLDDRHGDFSPDLISILEKMRDLIESRMKLLEENRLWRLFANESMLRKILDNIPVAVGCHTLDGSGRILYLNQLFTDLFGYTLADLPTTDIWVNRAYPDEQSRTLGYRVWKDAVEHAVQTSGKVELIESRVTCKDGRVLDVLISASVLEDMLLTSFVDISQQKRTELDLVHTKERLEATLNALPDMMFRLDRDGTFLDSHTIDDSQYFVPPSQFMGKRVTDIFPAETSRIIMAGLEDAAEAGICRGTTYSLPTSEGTGWYELSIVRIKGEAGRDYEFISLIRDVTRRVQAEQELRAANEELARIAITDSLTGLWNRRYIEDFATAEMAQAQRYGQALSLLMLDVDHFKSINDRYGHVVGDRVLVEFGQRLSLNLRAADRLARWGGEEFIVVMPHCGAAEAAAAAEKLRVLIAEQPFTVAGDVTASIGVAEWLAGETLDEWFKRADDAMYAAKFSGRNAVRLAE